MSQASILFQFKFDLVKGYFLKRIPYKKPKIVLKWPYFPIILPYISITFRWPKFLCRLFKRPNWCTFQFYLGGKIYDADFPDCRGENIKITFSVALRPHTTCDQHSNGKVTDFK